MIIKKLHINNFLSFGPENSIDLENRGLVFIKGENKDTGGSNGSGKSSLVEAIVYTLTGKTVRGVDSVDDVVNNVFGKDCSCKIDTDNGFILRARKDDKVGTGLFLNVDGEDKTKPDPKRTQKEINDLYNVDFDTFINSTILSFSSKQANFLDNRYKTERRQIIETILGINKYNDYLSVAKEKIRHLEDSRVLNNKEIEKIKVQIEDYKRKIIDIEEKKSSYEKIKQEKIAVIDAQVNRLSSIDFDSNIGVYKKINEAKDIIRSIDVKIAEKSSAVKPMTFELSKLRCEVNKYEQLGAKACSHCGSTLTQERVDSIIVPTRSKIKELEDGIAKIQQEYDYYKTSKESIISQLDALKPEASEKELYELNTKLEMLRGRVLELYKEENPYHSLNFTEEIKNLEMQITELENEIKLTAEELKYYYFWETGFGNKGLKSYILEDMIMFFNKRIQFYLDILSRNTITIIFDKHLDFSVSGLNYSNCSGGERRRADLAVLIALYELSNIRSKTSHNILILDEVLDSIDTIGFESAMDLLRELNKKVPTILVISHSDKIEQHFDKVITVVKENKISHIEE